MTRPLRLQIPGAFYHVTSRGNARADIFWGDSDRHSFLDLLSLVVRRFNWLCYAYCLMDNHYHLLIETPEANISSGMRHLNGVYTQIINRKHNRVGHIFQGRFEAILIEKEHHLLELCRYVVLNPVRAGIINAPEEWVWSSYRATAGLEESPSFLTTLWVLACFGKTLSPSQRAYRKFVKEGIREKSPWERITGQIYLGDKEFLEEVHEYIRGNKEMPEIPRQQRLISRPLLEEFFGPLARREKEKRNQLIVEAHERYGYSLKEISNALGLHYTTISKVMHTRN